MLKCPQESMSRPHVAPAIQPPIESALLDERKSAATIDANVPVSASPAYK